MGDFLEDKPFDANFEPKWQRKRRWVNWKIKSLKDYLHEARREKNYYRYNFRLKKVRNEELRATIRDLKREHSKEIKQLHAKIGVLQRANARQAISNQKMSKIKLDKQTKNKRHLAARKKLEAELKYYYQNKRFFKKEFFWNHGNYHHERIELLMRYVMGYESLRVKELVNIKELVILFGAYQIEYFNKKDIERRFGSEMIVNFERNCIAMQKRSYIKRMHNTQNYFITELGKERLIGILKYTYTFKLKPYFTEIA